MRKIIFGFLWFIGTIQPLSAQTAQTAALTGIYVLAGLMPDNSAVFEVKFGLQFAAGMYDPKLAAVMLGSQSVLRGDTTAGNSGLSMANRALAQGYAGYFNSTETKGYGVAAALNGVALFPLEHWQKGDLCNLIQDWKIPGAFVNMLYQGMLGWGYAPEMAGLMTSVATGVVAAAPISQEFRTTFVAETGFRLLPSMTSMVVSHADIRTMVNCVGMFLIWQSKQMQHGHAQTFVSATGTAFLIGAVMDMVERFKKGMDEV